MLFATIDATTLSTAEIEAMAVAVSTMITVARTAARSATVANARLAMGIALATTRLERGNPWLAAKKTTRARAPRAECTATRVARQNMSGPNARRARPIKRSWQRSVRKHTMHDKHHPASDVTSLSEHRTALAGDKSSKGYSSRSDHSDDEDNLAVAILTSPCKRAKHDVLPPKRKLNIANTIDYPWGSSAPQILPKR